MLASEEIRIALIKAASSAYSTASRGYFIGFLSFRICCVSFWIKKINQAASATAKNNPAIGKLVCPAATISAHEPKKLRTKWNIGSDLRKNWQSKQDNRRACAVRAAIGNQATNEPRRLQVPRAEA